MSISNAVGLKGKLQLIVAVAAAGLLSMAAFWLHGQRARMLSEKQQQLTNMVEIAYSILVESHELEVNGKISRQEAQERAIAVTKSLRYQGGGFFFISDMSPTHPVLIMHPMKPELQGTDRANRKDPTGKAYVVEMVDTVRKHGAGFVSYKTQKPGKQQDTLIPKLSFVKGFEPWGWIIGTGIYIDDVDAAWRENATKAGGIFLACLAVVLVIAVSVSRSIFIPLGRIVDRMKDVAQCEGDFAGRIDVFHEDDPSLSRSSARQDEIGVLLSGFNEMLQQIQERDEKLQRHGERLEQEVSQRTAELRVTNVQLASAHAETELFLACIPSILIGTDTSGRITRWNLAAANTFGVNAQSAIGRSLANCGIKWLRTDMEAEISRWLRTETALRYDNIAYEKDQKVRFLGIQVRRIMSAQADGFIITGADITERKCLEEQLSQAHKLEAIGQLAAGIAHEINTPTQYVVHNTTFLKESWDWVIQLLNLCQIMRQEAGKDSVSRESLAKFDQLVEQADFEYLQREIPSAIDQSLEGLQRVAKIVRAMKEFSHPGTDEKTPVHINRAIETTIAVAKNEWKYVADVITEFEDGLPLVPCLQGEFNQVILNLIVNAAQAIAGVVGDGNKEKGKITISTRRNVESVEIAIRDTGMGIPHEIRSRVFEPFFTTKPVGKGTGQGLSLAYSAIVKRHQGQIWFETELGHGTTFFIRLPLVAHPFATV